MSVPDLLTHTYLRTGRGKVAPGITVTARLASGLCHLMLCAHLFWRFFHYFPVLRIAERQGNAEVVRVGKAQNLPSLFRFVNRYRARSHPQLPADGIGNIHRNFLFAHQSQLNLKDYTSASIPDKNAAAIVQLDSNLD
jgi:hypothetical protein